jgi:hypothetical protein
MPTNNINVKLNGPEKDQPPVLDVEDHGGLNQVPKHSQPTDIIWKLTGDLAQGNFADMNGTDPGFEWVTRPPDGIFSDPELLSDKRLKIVDKHSDSKSGGVWIYKLRVVSGTTIYATTGHFVSASSKDPVIINKDP